MVSPELGLGRLLPGTLTFNGEIMIWLLSIPTIIYFTFRNLCESSFPSLDAGSRNFLEWAFLIFVGCFFSALISLVPIGIASYIGSIPQVWGVPAEEYQLVSLHEKDGGHGKFYFLGAGTISDRQYYFWYAKRQDGAVVGGKTSRVPAVEVYESDGTPKMVIYRAEYKKDWPKKYLWLVGIDQRDKDDFYPTFYIPKGSIKEGFVL